MNLLSVGGNEVETMGKLVSIVPGVFVMMTSSSVLAAPSAGPEYEPDPPIHHVIGGNPRIYPTSAFNGSMYLVVFSAFGQVRARRIDADGNVMDPDDIILDDSFVTSERMLSVVADGSDFIVVYLSNQGVRFARVDPTGSVISNIPLDYSGQGLGIVRGASTLFMVDKFANVRLYTLDGDLLAGPIWPIAGCFGGSAEFAQGVYMYGCTDDDFQDKPYVVRFDESLTMLDAQPHLLAQPASKLIIPVIATDGNEFMTISSDGLSTHVGQRFTTGGAPVGLPITFPSLGGLAYINGYYDMPLGSRHRRFTTLGASIDPTPITIATTIGPGALPGQRVSYVAGDPRALLTFLDASSSVVGSLVGSDGQPLKEDFMISSSAVLASNQQTNLTLATNAQGVTVALWVDDRQGATGTYAMRFDENGDPLDSEATFLMSNPLVTSIASDGTDFLLVYGQTPDWSARTLDADLVLGPPVTYQYYSDVAQLLVWASDADHYIYSKEIKGDEYSHSYRMTLVDTAGAQQTSADLPYDSRTGGVSVAFDGANHVVAFALRDNLEHYVTKVTRVSPSGVADPTPTYVASGKLPSIAYSNGTRLLSYGPNELGNDGNGPSFITRIAADTTLLDFPTQIAASGRVTVFPTESEFIVGVQSGPPTNHDLSATYVGLDGQLKDSFVVSNSPDDESGMLVAGNGRFVVYIHDDSADGYRGKRVRARKLNGYLSNGAGCSEAGPCDSGYCVDGVCCESDCVGGTCDSSGVCSASSGTGGGGSGAGGSGGGGAGQGGAAGGGGEGTGGVASTGGASSTGGQSSVGGGGQASSGGGGQASSSGGEATSGGSSADGGGATGGAPGGGDGGQVEGGCTCTQASGGPGASWSQLLVMGFAIGAVGRRREHARGVRV